MGATEIILGVAAILASVAISTVGGIVWYTTKQDSKIELIRKDVERRYDGIETQHQKQVEAIKENAANAQTIACQVQISADVLTQIRDDMRVKYALKGDLERLEEKVEELLIEFWKHVGETSLNRRYTEYRADIDLGSRESHQRDGKPPTE
jgi:hypothetical protein